MATPQELLEQQRTATRMDPGGARSAVYGQPAGQVPQGVVSRSTTPLPARTSNLQGPGPAGNPAVRAALTGRPAIEPGIVERMAANRPAAPQATMPSPTAGAVGTPPVPSAPAPTATGIPQARLDRVRNMPGRLPASGMAPPTTGNAAAPGTSVFSPVRAAIEATDSSIPRTGAPAAAAPSPAAGPVTGAAQRAGRAVGTAMGGAAELAKNAGRVGLSVVGPMQALQGVEQMTGDGGALDKAGGAVRTAAGTAATLQGLAPGFTSRVLPRMGPAGAAAAVGMTAGDIVAGPIMEWVRSNPGALKLVNAAREAVGSPALTPIGQQAAPPPNVYGPTVAGQNGVPQPVTTNPANDPRAADEAAVAKADNAAPPRINPQSGDWNDINRQVREGQGARDATRVELLRQELQNPNLTPENRAALERELARATAGGQTPGPISRAAGMSREGQAQVARLQQQAGTPQEAPALTDDRFYRAVPGIVGMAAGGNPDGSNSARAVWGLQLPAMPEERGGQVIVDRGGQESIATQRPEGQLGYNEQMTGVPELAGDSVQDIAKWAVDLEARGMGRAGDIITRYLASLESAGAQRYGADQGLQGDRVRAGATVEAANIGANAQRYEVDRKGPAVAVTEAPVFNPDGTPVFGVTQKTPSYWNSETRRWEQVQGAGTPAVEPQYVAPARYNKFLQDLIKQGYTERQARDYAASKGVYERKEN